MRRKILILSAVLISPFSHAESWESITKSTYQSSAYAESKQITNQDGSKITVYYIDAAMQASACQGAKSSAQSVFTRIKPTYEGIWPDSEFRLVFTGDCTYSDSPGQKDKYWSLTAYIVGNIQRSVPDENLLTRHQKKFVKRSRQKKVYLIMLIHMMVVAISTITAVNMRLLVSLFVRVMVLFALQHGSLQVL